MTENGKNANNITVEYSNTWECRQEMHCNDSEVVADALRCRHYSRSDVKEIVRQEMHCNDSEVAADAPRCRHYSRSDVKGIVHRSAAS
jgi:hypothetical protein